MFPRAYFAAAYFAAIYFPGDQSATAGSGSGGGSVAPLGVLAGGHVAAPVYS